MPVLGIVGAHESLRTVWCIQVDRLGELVAEGCLCCRVAHSKVTNGEGCGVGVLGWQVVKKS